MNSFKENWDDKDFYLKNQQNLKVFTKNNKERVKNLPFEFVDYKANMDFPCLIYHKSSLACLDKHGISRQLMESKDCLVY